MDECRQCGTHVEEGVALCPRCAGASAESTESFEPIVGTDEVLGPLGADEGPMLVVRKGPQPGERFYLDRPALSMGRDPSSDIFLNDMTVSRAHANLEVVGDIVTVRDAGSLNGTYVNGVCVDVAELHDGDVLQIGTFQMAFHGGGARG